MLLPKLDALIGDREQWDMYSQLEEERVMDVVHTLPFSLAEKYRRLVIEDMH